MIKRIPRYAETKFSNLCAIHGALCHHSEEDENGWDYLVEFPQHPGPTPADTRPAPSTAYVQVKSTSKKQLTCRVKLSNALRAAQSLQPWFIVLIAVDARQRTAVYGVHVWRGLIEATFMAVRQAEIEKKPLNRKYLRVKFGVADKHNYLLSWMEETISSLGPDYGQNKKQISGTVGFEHGRGVINFRIEAPANEIADNFLGRGRGLQVRDFRYTPTRFGLISREPLINVSSGVVHFSPLPFGPGELRVRSSTSPSPVILSGQIYTLGPPFADQRVRFTAEFAEMVFSAGKIEFRLKLDPQEKTSLKTIENFAVLNKWLTAGPIDIQIWVKNKRIFSSAMKCEHPLLHINWPNVSEITELLGSIASPDDQNRLRLSMTDIKDSWRSLVTLEQVANGVSMRWELPQSPELPPQISSLIYYAIGEVSGWTFYVLDERPMVEDIQIGEIRRITCGLPQRIETYCLENATAEQQRMVEEDYERYLTQRREAGLPFGLGDMRAYVKNTNGN
jgi:hypothetical protein